MKREAVELGDALEAHYAARRPALHRLRDAVISDLQDVVGDDPLVERVTGRVKSDQQFLVKARKVRKDGGPKYPHPLEEIQDQVGCRIIVKFEGERDRVKDEILAIFRPVEDRFHQPEEADRFGYEARHLVCLVPPDIREKTESPIDFFELQVCTLFQHAWAEANHDIGYKSAGPLSWDEQRMIALTAANAWGADRVFEELRRKQRSSSEQ